MHRLGSATCSNGVIRSIHERGIDFSAPCSFNFICAPRTPRNKPAKIATTHRFVRTHHRGDSRSWRVIGTYSSIR